MTPKSKEKVMTSIRSISKLVYAFVIAFSCPPAIAQNYLVENSIRTTFSLDRDVFIGSNGAVYVFSLQDTTLKVNYSTSKSLESFALYTELEIPRSAEVLGVFRDSVLLRTTIKFGQGIQVKGFAMVPFDGGQTRAWQSILSESGMHRDGHWYTTRKVPGGFKVEKFNIVTERLESTMTYSGSDSVVFIMSKSDKWLGLFWDPKGLHPSIKYNEPSVGWIPFPYPLNSSKRVKNFTINGETEFVVVYADTLNTYNISQFEISEMETNVDVKDSLKIGDYSFFYNVDSLESIGGSQADLQEVSSSKVQVLPTDLKSVEPVRDTGRFSVIVQSFKNSKDAFEFLNELVKVLPGAKAVRRNQNVDVVGPQRTSLSSVKADSAFLAKKNFPTTISASRDYEPIPSMYVTLFIKDKVDSQPVEAVVSVYSRKEDEVLASGAVDNGKVYFVFPKDQADIGLTVTASGYLPRSIRVSTSDFNSTQKFTEVIALEHIPEAKEFSIELNNILFEFDSFELTNVSKTELRSVSELLGEYSIDTLHIIGHCDSVGTDAYNERLGEKRAKAVALFLKDQNVDAKPTVTSMGETKPIVSNDTELGRSLNRRVEFQMSVSDKDAKESWQIESSSPEDKAKVPEDSLH